MSEFVTIEFEDYRLKDEFLGWFFSGGGEDCYHDAMECRDVDMTIKHKNDNIYVNNFEGEI